MIFCQLTHTICQGVHRDGFDYFSVGFITPYSTIEKLRLQLLNLMVYGSICPDQHNKMMTPSMPHSSTPRGLGLFTFGCGRQWLSAFAIEWE
jgi:hypothetical protein